MNKVTSLIFVTAIAPNPNNANGPSGLPWEIIEALKRNGWDVQLQIYQLPTSRVRRRLTQLSIPIGEIEFKREDNITYMVYPFYLGTLVPSDLRSRTILLGPDASSMFYSRLARVQAGWQRWISLCLTHWFAFLEGWAARRFAAMAVVGRNDVRWLRGLVGDHSAHLHFLPHPILTSISRSRPSADLGGKCRLIFAGDLSKKYVGNFFQAIDYKLIAKILATSGCEVLVVGKGNQFIHNMISSHLQSHYIPWVEDYATLCNPLSDIHVIPLMAGAGTKNRMLTALAMNVIVISTPIGTENIDPQVLSNASVSRFKSAEDFPRALTVGLEDLRIRRISGVAPLAPPIACIDTAFNKSLMNLVEGVAQKSNG